MTLTTRARTRRDHIARRQRRLKFRDRVKLRIRVSTEAASRYIGEHGPELFVPPVSTTVIKPTNPKEPG